MTHINTSLLHAYLDNELSPEQTRLVDNHLDACPDCRLELTRLQRLKLTLGGITSPNPGHDYFRQLQDKIAARTIGRDQTIEASSSSQAPGIPKGQYILRLLIRLAAVITLLFASFYVAQVVQQTRGEKWAETTTENGLAQEDSIQTGDETIEFSPGINRIGSPAPDNDLIESDEDK